MHTVLRALAETGDPRAWDPLAHLLTLQLSADLLREVDATLIQLGDPRGLEHLMDAIRNESPHARSYARTLCRLATPLDEQPPPSLCTSSDTRPAPTSCAPSSTIPTGASASDLPISLPGLAVRARLALGDPLQARLADRNRR